MNTTRIEQCEYIVSSLNNFLEKHKDESDGFIEDIIDEMGFGYCPSEPDTIQFACGDDLIDVTNISVNNLFMRIVENGVDWELIEFLWEND